MMIKCIAFDCFGTIFKMDVPQEQIADYVAHVRKNEFSPYWFPDAWWKLKAHDDSAPGIKRLQENGFKCWALSNGSADLIRHISSSNGIEWDGIVDLVKHRVYKPHVDAYRTLQADSGFEPHECLMVTANPTFGDIEGSAAIGMPSMVIRAKPRIGSTKPMTVIDLADTMTANAFYSFPDTNPPLPTARSVDQ